MGLATLPEEGLQLPVCPRCWAVALRKNNQYAGELYRALDAARGAGHTEAGFIDSMIRSARAYGGRLVIAEIRVDVKEYDYPYSPFLALGINPFDPNSENLVWSRSRFSLAPPLERAASPHLQRVRIEPSMVWSAVPPYNAVCVGRMAEGFIRQALPPSQVIGHVQATLGKLGTLDFLAMVANDPALVQELAFRDLI